MQYSDILNNARDIIGKKCRVCKECNGIVCKGEIPGVGGKYTGEGFKVNYEKLKEIKINMDTIYEFKEVDTSIELFGKKFNYPVFAAPIGALNLHYSDILNDEAYSRAIIAGCKQGGTAGFTGDGVKDEFYELPLKTIKEVDGWGIPTIKPWKKDEILKKVKQAEEVGALAVAMDVDAAGLALLAALGKPVSPKSVEELKEIISSTKLPFIIKGIMTVKGALKALKAGAYGIVISNHGGRVLDQTPATVEVLPEIAKAVKGKMKNSAMSAKEDESKIQPSLDAMEKLEDEEGAEVAPDLERDLDASEKMGGKATIATGSGTTKQVNLTNSILPDAEAMKKRDPFIDNDLSKVNDKDDTFVDKNDIADDKDEDLFIEV